MDIEAIRSQFPALRRTVNGSPMVYLDSASTTLKPQCVIDAIMHCYEKGLGNASRGIHTLAVEASDAFQESRSRVASFLNAEPDEIIFTQNATDAINLISLSLPGPKRVLGGSGEHHSNLLPWRAQHHWMEARQDEHGILDLDSWESSLESTTIDLATFSAVSNVTGAIQPMERLVDLCHRHKTLVLIDASQAVGHFPIDLQVLDCDFLCFSAHKMFGPSGIGVCFARQGQSEWLRPYKHGGGMVDDVTADLVHESPIPQRFEAGTPSVEAAVGLAAACDFLDEIGIEKVQQHQAELTEYLLQELRPLSRLHIVGPISECERSSIVAFYVDGLEAHGLARMLDRRFGIMVRSGYHCAQLLHTERQWRPTIRVSFAIYNTKEEVKKLVSALGILLSI